MKNQSLKALCLSFLAALGLMAFMAIGAQASGKFLIEDPHGGSWLEETIKAEVEHALQGGLLILKLNLEFSCHEISATGKVTSHGHGLAEILFKTCLSQLVNSSGELTGESCQPELDLTVKALLLVILHSGGEALTVDQTPLTAKTEHQEGTGDAYILITPFDGLTLVAFEGHPCPLLGKMIFKGCLVAKVEHPAEHQVVKLMTTKEMLTLFGCKLTYGAHEVHWNQDMLVQLSGLNLGKKWGAL